jgi:hypothetical protein
MEFRGRIMKVLPMESGTSAQGNEWKKQFFIFEYFERETDRYSDKVCLSVMNDKIAECDLHVNDEVIIGFGHSIREYQGRCYNELRIYKLQKVGASAQAETRPEPNTAQAAAQAQAAQGTQAAPNMAQQQGEADPLPF